MGTNLHPFKNVSDNDEYNNWQNVDELHIKTLMSVFKFITVENNGHETSVLK